jgi:peptide/nickel transport system substrate-binding protein
MPSADAPARSARRVGARVLAAALAVVVLVGCDVPRQSPTPVIPSPTPTATRPFTVLSTDRVATTDPAAVHDPASALVSLNAFQRLMTADPGQAVLKPDAARDCLFTATTIYTCTLKDDLFFHNGHPLTSSDVAFSISRARELDVPGSSAPLLDSLRRIDTPDPLTVRFLLSRVDTQFGWALASPAASLVDEESYRPDQVRPVGQPVVGSGPYRVTRVADGTITFSRYAGYAGRNPGQTEDVVYRTVADSGAIEDAMTSGTADVVWRGPSEAAITRFARQIQLNPGQLTDAGYGLVALTGTRVRLLYWSPASPRRANRSLRQALAVALQGDRTLDSVVPGGVPGHVSAFPTGGDAEPELGGSGTITLDLGYDPTMPDGEDAVHQIADRLEDTGRIRVRLRPGDDDVDLTLVDAKAWTATGWSWLQPYLRSPLPQSRAVLATLEERYRTRTDEVDALRTLAAIQRQAALDATIVPVSQSDEYVLARDGVSVSVGSFGPGWQLGLWGMSGG